MTPSRSSGCSSCTCSRFIACSNRSAWRIRTRCGPPERTDHDERSKNQATAYPEWGYNGGTVRFLPRECWKGFVMLTSYFNTLSIGTLLLQPKPSAAARSPPVLRSLDLHLNRIAGSRLEEICSSANFILDLHLAAKGAVCSTPCGG